MLNKYFNINLIDLTKQNDEPVRNKITWKYRCVQLNKFYGKCVKILENVNISK